MDVVSTTIPVLPQGKACNPALLVARRISMARWTVPLQAIDWAIQMFGGGSVFHLLHVVPEPQVPAGA